MSATPIMSAPDTVAWHAGSPTDAGPVAQMMRTAFDPRYGEAWSEAQLAAALAGDTAWIDVGTIGGELVAFSLCRIIFEEVELLLCAIAPRYRGTGVGTAMIARVAETSRGRGARRLFLEVREDNEPARRLYARHGFRLVGRRRGYYRGTDGVPRDALTMSREL
jgi:ribosomal-protein-alanine N-acetyltransferase